MGRKAWRMQRRSDAHAHLCTLLYELDVFVHVQRRQRILRAFSVPLLLRGRHLDYGCRAQSRLEVCSR